MAYIGRDLRNFGEKIILDSLTASATADYTLQLNSVDFVPSSASALTVSLNGVIQKPESSFTVSGSTLSFSSALTADDTIDFVIAERNILFQVPSAGSVQATQVGTGVINSQTAETTHADDDEILIYDNSASALRKMTRANFVSGAELVESTSGIEQSGLTSLTIALPETYKSFKLDIHLKPENDNSHVYCRFSSDDGATYHESANNYGYSMLMIYNSTDGDTDNEQSNGATAIFLSKGVGNNTTNAEAFNAVMDIKPIHTESSKNQANQITWSGTRITNDNATYLTTGTGILQATYTAKANYFKIYFSSGNVEEYFYNLWGYR